MRRIVTKGNLNWVGKVPEDRDNLATDRMVGEIAEKIYVSRVVTNRLKSQYELSSAC